MDPRDLFGTRFFLEVSLPGIVLLVTGALFLLLERIWPVRHQDWKGGFFWNTVGFVVSSLVATIVVLYAGLFLRPFDGVRPEWTWPGPSGRALLFFLGADLSRYVVHRWMHGRLLWRSHRFHHSVETLHWYGGSRTSFVHCFLFYAPMAVLAWFLEVGPIGIAVQGTAAAFFQVFQHCNVRLPLAVERPLEWVFVTPRFHCIHHSVVSAHNRTNYGSILTIWDRLAGTLASPDEIEAGALRFGNAEPEQPPMLRQLLGF